MRTLVELVSMSESPAAENWIQIMKTGKFVYGGQEIQITNNDLQEFKENFDKNVRGVKLAVDVSHRPDDGSVAWFEEVQVRGDQLWAKVGWTQEGKQLIKSGKFRYFSPEFMFSWTDPESRKTYKNVLFGGAITNRPFLKDMQPIEMDEGDLGVIWFSDGDTSGNSVYDPDGDGDDDSTTDPKKNPDWHQDVMAGITPWPSDPDQQKELMDRGATREACDAAHSVRQNQLKMSESGVTNAHKSPPKGKPQDKSQYADPSNYKYPIDADHIRAAVSMFNNSANKSAGGYSDAQWTSIGEKIASAANRLIGKGHSFKDGKIQTPSTTMDDENTGISPDDGSSKVHPVDDANAGKFNEPASHTNQPVGGANKVDENQTVSMSEYNAAMGRIALLEQEQKQTKMSEAVNGFVQAGKIVPAQRDKLVSFMTSLNDEQVAKFNEVMAEAKPVIEFSEIGMSGGDAGHGDKGDKEPKVLLSERTAKIATEKSISFSEAARLAQAELIAEGVKFD